MFVGNDIIWDIIPINAIAYLIQCVYYAMILGMGVGDYTCSYCSILQIYSTLDLLLSGPEVLADSVSQPAHIA